MFRDIKNKHITLMEHQLHPGWDLISTPLESTLFVVYGQRANHSDIEERMKTLDNKLNPETLLIINTKGN